MPGIKHDTKFQIVFSQAQNNYFNLLLPEDVGHMQSWLQNSSFLTDRIRLSPLLLANSCKKCSNQQVFLYHSQIYLFVPLPFHLQVTYSWMTYSQIAIVTIEEASFKDKSKHVCIHCGYIHSCISFPQFQLRSQQQHWPVPRFQLWFSYRNTQLYLKFSGKEKFSAYFPWDLGKWVYPLPSLESIHLE